MGRAGAGGSKCCGVQGTARTQPFPGAIELDRGTACGDARLYDQGERPLLQPSSLLCALPWAGCGLLAKVGATKVHRDSSTIRRSVHTQNGSRRTKVLWAAATGSVCHCCVLYRGQVMVCWQRYASVVHTRASHPQHTPAHQQLTPAHQQHTPTHHWHAPAPQWHAP